MFSWILGEEPPAGRGSEKWTRGAAEGRGPGLWFCLPEVPPCGGEVSLGLRPSQAAVFPPGLGGWLVSPFAWVCKDRLA